MSQAGQVFVNFGANTQGLLAGTARAGNILQKFSQTGMGAAVVLGASFVTVSRAITNFSTDAINGFKEFDFAMNRTKALSGATETEFKQLTATALELGRITEYSAKDAAEGMANLALAGFNTKEILAAIPQGLRLATAGGVGLAKTNTIMSNAIRGFRLESDQANQVANVLTATFTTTNTTLESLAQTFKNATGPLSVLGVQMEEVAAAAGVLGDVGIIASVAGTGLKNFGIKLAKSFGVDMDAANQTAKEFFETLGVTKDRLFDATTGTFDMVEATIAFKQAMDKLGSARAPEFLGKFSTLFGERNAVALSALVKEAEKLKIQSQNIRMTEMVGDIQHVFEGMKSIGNDELFMTNLQQGMNKSVKDMVSILKDANSYMEEFESGGGGANLAIERLSNSFENVQSIMENTFGDTGGKVFDKTEDGLMRIMAYTRNNSKEMLNYQSKLEELAKKDITGNRRKELEAERDALFDVISADKRTVEELTTLGRSRLISFAAQIKYIGALKEGKDGTSKAVQQMLALNEIYRGNEKNMLLAAQAVGVNVSANDKLEGVMGRVKDQLLKTANSADIQNYAMSRLASQAAMVNTAWDMQRVQLSTLHGTMELFQSNMETLTLAIGKSFAPAINAALLSGGEFLRVFTRTNDEVVKGTSAFEVFNNACTKTIDIFKMNGGVLKELNKNFEQLSDWGKVLTSVLGTLGLSGLAAGGAFVWVSALAPAFSVLVSTFLTVVAPILIIVTLITKLGIELNKARQNFEKLRNSLKNMSIEGENGISNIINVANKLGISINKTDAAMIQLWTNLEGRMANIKESYNGLIDSMDKILGRTEKLNIIGGRFQLFKEDQQTKAKNLVSTAEELEKIFPGVADSAGSMEEKFKAAFNIGNAEEMSKILKNNKGIMDKISAAGFTFSFATESQITKIRSLNGQLLDAQKIQELASKELFKAIGLREENRITQERFNEIQAAEVDAIRQVENIEKQRDSLYGKLLDKQGRSGRLTNIELEKLEKIKTSISEQGKLVNKAKEKYKDLVKQQKNGVDVSKELPKVYKEYSEQYDILIESQKEYNKILNDSTSKNPFILLMRIIKQISKNDSVQKMILEVGRLVSDVVKYVAEELLPRITNILGTVYNFAKSGMIGTANPILKLIKSIGGLLGDIIKYSLDAIGNLFSYIAGDSDKVIGGLSNGIERLANFIDKIRSKIEPFIKGIGILTVVLYEIIKSIIVRIGPPIFNLIKSVFNLITSVGGAIIRILEDVFGKVEGKIDILGIIAYSINEIAKVINRVANAIRGAQTGELEKMGGIGLVIAASFMLVFKAAKLITGVIGSIGTALSGFKTSAKYVDDLFKPLLKGNGLFQTFGNIASKALSFVGSNLLLVSSTIAGIIVVIGALSEAWKRNFGNIKGYFKELVSTMLNFWGMILKETWGLISKITTLISSIIKLLFNIGKSLAPIIGPLIALSMAIASAVFKVVGFLIKEIFTMVKGAIQVITDILNSDFVQSLITLFANIFEMVYNIVSFITNIVKTMVKVIIIFMQPIINSISSIVSIVQVVIRNVVDIIQIFWRYIIGLATNLITLFSGIAETVSGIFTWDIDKIRSGLATIFEALASTAIKIYEFWASLIAKIPALLIECVSKAFGEILKNAGKWLSWIPGIGPKIQEALGGFGEDMSGKGSEISKSIMSGVADSVTQMENGVNNIADKIRGVSEEAVDAKTKSNGIFEKGKEAQKKIVKKKEDKENVLQRMEKAFATIQDIPDKLGEVKGAVDNNTNKTVDARPNVTNNTYVEYRAAEDDEVNRRMIERVMNDILKADVGSIMGDTAGMNG
jgi:TP901 family phage tail tape measure protein